MDVRKQYVWLGWLWCILLAFHLSVFCFVAAQLHRKNQYYKSAFFQIYLLHSVANYGVLLTYLLLNLDACTTSWGSVCFECVIIVYYFMQFLQQFSYTTIACNRFSAIVLPLQHAKLWKPVTFWVLLFVQIVLSLAFASVRLVQRTLLLWQYDLSLEDAANQAGSTRAGVTAAAYFACFLVDAVLELWTFVAYHRLDFVGKRNHNENYRLLVYTLLGMVINSYLVSYYAMIVIHFIDHEVLEIVSLVVVHLQSLLGPIFLVLTSKSVRLDYLEFYYLRIPASRKIGVFESPDLTAT